MRKYSGRLLFLIAGLVLGLLIGRADTMPALASPNSQSSVGGCDGNKGNILECLVLLEKQNSERLDTIQKVLIEQQTSVKTINDNVVKLTSASNASSELILQALTKQDTEIQDLSAAHSLGLQMVMEKYEESSSTLSELIQKNSDTIVDLIQNSK